MATLKEQMLNDIHVFFNPDEFGEEHKINDDMITIMIDNEFLKELKSNKAEGLMKAEVLFFIATNDVNFPKSDKAKLILDDKLYKITSYQEHVGVSQVILEAIR